jgi:L-lactate dehydrogenase (cytochrome)
MAPSNVRQYRELARRRLPRAIFDYVDGGAEDEITLRSNEQAFEDVALVPRVLVDVSDRDLSTSVCGIPVRSPVLLAPTGLAGMIHPDGELAAATAAARHGTISMLSSGSTYTIEEVAAGSAAPPWLQLYPLRDRAFYGALVERAAAAGFAGLCLTVDVPLGGNRERDLANGMTLPPKLTFSNMVDTLRRPGWVARTVRHRRVVAQALANEDDQPPGLMFLLQKASFAAGQTLAALNPSVTWDDLRWVRERWKGPLAVKGLLRAADALRAVELGADAIVVSNHGGRQLDGAEASFHALPAVVDAVGDKADVILDGGVRRGSQVVKALCVGAKACMIGRPWLYGLGARGVAGVDDVLDIFNREISVVLALLGQPSVRALDRTYLAWSS